MKAQTLAASLVILMLVGCKSAYYGAWSKLGYEKRDILVSEVEKAKTDQEKAKEQFKTTMERFQELTGVAPEPLDPESAYKGWRLP